MKWKKSFFTLSAAMLLFLFVFKMDSSAADVIRVDSEHFPDMYFRRYITDVVDLNKDGKLSGAEIEQAEIMHVEDYLYPVEDFAGLGYFTELTELAVYGEQLESLDVSGNPKLERLMISATKIKQIDLSRNKQLKDIGFYDNKFKKLDLSANTKLELVSCENNELTSIDVTKCLRLRALYCNYNRLKKLDVTNNKKLYILSVGYNPLRRLNVSKNTKLVDLSCEWNYLKKLDVKKNKKLQSLNCQGNNLTKLDLKNNKYLMELNCEDNKIKKLNVSKNKKLKRMMVDRRVTVNIPKKSDFLNTEAQISKLSNPANGVIKLEIEKVSGAKGYHIYVSEKKDFDDTYYEETVCQEYAMYGLEKGEYYVKVCPYFKNGKVGKCGTVKKVKVTRGGFF